MLLYLHFDTTLCCCDYPMRLPQKPTATVRGRGVVPRHDGPTLAGRKGAGDKIQVQDHISRIIAKQSTGPCLGSFAWLVGATGRRSNRMAVPSSLTFVPAPPPKKAG